MKILVIHNSYYAKGGEDTAVEEEVELLRKNGVDVRVYTRSNKEIEDFGLLEKMALPVRIVWSRKISRAIKALTADFRPDIVHVHNTFFLISPSIYSIFRRRGIPVVKTLQNYRYLCPAATFYRNGRVCEDCLGKRIPIDAFIHGCYRDSRVDSAALVGLYGFHNIRRTFFKEIDEFIAVSHFMKAKFVEAGYPPDRISVKPNMLTNDPGMRIRYDHYALFVGRFAKEKGVETVLRALEGIDRPIKILGAGPLAAEIEQYCEKNKSATKLGWVSHEKMYAILRNAKFLIFASEWFEGFPLVIAEAFACGVPVLASNIGSMREMITEGKTGLFFRAGDPADLAAKAEWAWNHPDDIWQMSVNARSEYEKKYTAQTNYQNLMEIYEKASRFAAKKKKHEI